jgi:hypothetical protein
LLVARIGEADKPIKDHYYQIRNVEDFIEGSWQDLFDMGRIGCSYDEPSLGYVEPARKQERQNREKALGRLSFFFRFG